MTNLKEQHIGQLEAVCDHYGLAPSVRDDLKHLLLCASDDYMDYVRATKELDGPEIYAKLVEIEDFMRSKVILEFPAQ